MEKTENIVKNLINILSKGDKYTVNELMSLLNNDEFNHLNNLKYPGNNLRTILDDRTENTRKNKTSGYEIIFKKEKIGSNLYYSISNNNIRKKLNLDILDRENEFLIQNLHEYANKKKNFKNIDELLHNVYPVKKNGVINFYERKPKITQITKERAEYSCEKCGKELFESKTSGKPYVEVHHIKELHNNGEDSINNTIALCPDCHREYHHGKDENKKRLLKEFKSIRGIK